MVKSLPFYCLVVGPTGSGKTKHVVDLLQGPFRHAFTFIILICPTFLVNDTWKDVGRGDKRFLVAIPDSSEGDQVEELLHHVADCFHDNKEDDVLVIVDDCAATADAKRRTSKLVDLTFSGRHTRISVWVLTQQLTSTAKPFREQLGCAVTFFNPERDSTDLFFIKYGGSSISAEEKKNIIEILKTHEFSKLSIRQKHPFSWHVEIPNTFL